MDKHQSGPSFRGQFLVYHLPVILYAAVVLSLSSIPDLKGPSVRHIVLDKPAHFLEYALFGFLTFRSFSNMTSRITNNLAGLLSVLSLSLFALLDEYYQSFVPGRNYDTADLVTDILGAFLVISFLWLRKRKTGFPEAS
jgi:VanZ family protein